MDIEDSACVEANFPVCFDSRDRAFTAHPARYSGGAKQAASEEQGAIDCSSILSEANAEI